MEQAYRDALDEARALPPAAGPFSGQLVPGASSPGERSAGVDLADFAASVTFAPQQDPVGVAFRRGGDGSEVRLLVSPDGGWTMSDGAVEFASGLFTMDRKNAKELMVKTGSFRSSTRTRKSVFITFVTTHGITQNDYSRQLMQNEVSMEALLRVPNRSQICPSNTIFGCG